MKIKELIQELGMYDKTLDVGIIIKGKLRQLKTSDLRLDHFIDPQRRRVMLMIHPIYSEEDEEMGEELWQTK